MIQAIKWMIVPVIRVCCRFWRNSSAVGGHKVWLCSRTSFQAIWCNRVIFHMITVCKHKGILYICEENKCLATLKTIGRSSHWFSKMLTSEQSSATEAVPMGLSELWHHSLAHVEDLDGEGGVPGCRSRRSHGAVAVDVLASYPLHFLRNCAKDCADGALFWRLWGTDKERGGCQSNHCSHHQKGCKRRSKPTFSHQEGRYWLQRLKVVCCQPCCWASHFNIFTSYPGWVFWTPKASSSSSGYQFVLKVTSP